MRLEEARVLARRQAIIRNIALAVAAYAITVGLLLLLGVTVLVWQAVL